ncbi:MAG: hypothetical protein QS748_10985 [Candidatus Endonucleobacter bathymodioli]|uniref:Uncharacterized protein n=1 Tax=Candidatus Endonucleibacter bathymodioli TaxID=539814 RepID=A0AA90NV95_9GAMM|nr:hypothetical protein [Candidatus Endonucleobacter bathymodioli]
MTNTQYLLGWAIYLIGATGCIVSFRLAIKKLPTRLTRALCIGTATLLYMPWRTISDQYWLAPAFLMAIYNRVGQTTHGAIDTAELVIIVAVTGSIILTLFVPVKKKSKSPKDNTKVVAKKCHPQLTRREPIL